MAGSKQPLVRTKRTMRRMSPLTREIQAIQNDLVAIARKLQRLQEHVYEAEQTADLVRFDPTRPEGRQPFPETQELLRQENGKAASSLRCDMSNCKEPITHIDIKGSVYCTKHSIERLGRELARR